ncbi:MAG: hypothetical protein IH934_06165 [Nanoarchaeota archaeon]|nr:hypothetical protein [Nanoarchaeota archaeon]
MKKKRRLIYFKNLINTFIFLLVLMTLISGCSTPKANIAEVEPQLEVPSDDVELPPQVPSGDIKTPPEIPSDDLTADTPPSIPSTQ